MSKLACLIKCYLRWTNDGLGLNNQNNQITRNERDAFPLSSMLLMRRYELQILLKGRSFAFFDNMNNQSNASIIL